MPLIHRYHTVLFHWLSDPYEMLHNLICPTYDFHVGMSLQRRVGIKTINLQYLFFQNLFSSSGEKNYWEKNISPTPQEIYHLESFLSAERNISGIVEIDLSLWNNFKNGSSHSFELIRDWTEIILASGLFQVVRTCLNGKMGCYGSDNWWHVRI